MYDVLFLFHNLIKSKRTFQSEIHKPAELNKCSINFQMNVFDALSKLIVSCSNFKVRKAAANALSVVTIREYYGDRIKTILPALLKALENSQNLPEFSEYKHQQNLIDQVCSGSLVNLNVISAGT